MVGGGRVDATALALLVAGATPLSLPLVHELAHELRDTINVSLTGLPLGRQVTRLRPEPGHSTSRTNF
jgi:hypothetical protein